jgi:hypothetical protein
VEGSDPHHGPTPEAFVPEFKYKIQPTRQDVTHLLALLTFRISSCMQHLLHFTLWLLCSYCDRPIQKKVKRPNPWEAPQLEKKRKEKLAVNFVKSRDTMQIPIDRKMLNEPGAEHQLRPKRDIEKGCASTRSMFLCPLDVSRSIHVRLLDFFIEEKNMPEDYKVREGHPAPTPKELKEFIRGSIESTEGRPASNG